MKVSTVANSTHFNTEIKFIEILKPEDENGVWEAEITIYNEMRKKEYKKVSTFFPKTWTPSDFMFEAYNAFNQIDINSKSFYLCLNIMAFILKYLLCCNSLKT